MKKTQEQYDVVVIGGGILGLSYANWVKKMRPESTVLVLEAKEHPTYKIGESTLSATVRNLVDLGFSYDLLRKIFHVKEGLGFWWTEAGSNDLHRPIDIVHLDETFQFDRRAFEKAFIKLSRSNGVQVNQGARINHKLVNRVDDITEISFKWKGNMELIKASIVCDATGPRRLLSRKLGEGVLTPESGFNSHSAYAYFKEKDTNFREEKWMRPMTRHICFEEGWMWFINLDDWTENDDEKLDAFCTNALDSLAINDTYKSRKEIESESNTEYEKIVSIGFVLNDKRFADIHQLSSAEIFAYMSNKYPAIREVMSHYQVIEKKFEDKTHFKRMNLPSRLKKFAGAGWLAVGEAAFLIDPLWSTGMTYGVGTSYMGAKYTVKSLNNSNKSTEYFMKYHEYCDFIYENVYKEINMYYSAFRDADLFEQTMLLKIAVIVTDIVKKVTYTEDDPYVWRITDPQWRSITEDIQDLLELSDASESKEEKKELKATILNQIGDFLENLKMDERFKHLKWGNYLTEFNDELKRDTSHIITEKEFDVKVCPSCNKWHAVSISLCPVCGFKGEEIVSENQLTLEEVI